MNPEATEYPQPTTTKLAEAERIADSELNANSDLNVNTEPGTLSKLPPAEKTTNQQWQQVNQQLSVFVDQLGATFKEYQKPLSTAGVVLAIIPFVVLTTSILEVIDTIPLLSSTFELIGFGFTSWFVYRYLLFVEKRQEFSRQYQELKERILGKSTPSV